MRSVTKEQKMSNVFRIVADPNARKQEIQDKIELLKVEEAELLAQIRVLVIRASTLKSRYGALQDLLDEYSTEVEA
jgi:hypothetical protein